VIVVLLEPVSRSGDLVLFRSQTGSGLGYWRGSVAQMADAEVDVEIDVVEGVDWRDIELLDEPMESMTIRNRQMEIQGSVSELNEDGVLSLCLGDGELRLDTTGQPPAKQPLGVRLILAAVEIYPTYT
jgi:hypothetical protein